MRNIVLYGALLALMLMLPFIIYPVLLMKLLCFALFASAFNLLLGYTGLLSFGHAAFFGGAAYITGHVLKEWGMPFEIGIIAGTLSAAALGFAFGSLAIRRTGIYFAMITLALAQMAYFVFVKAPFTHGEDGLQAIPRGTFLGLVDLNDNLAFYYVVLGICVAGFLLVARAISSPFGQILKGIRENEERVVSLGYDVSRYKLLAFVLSSGLAGLAGSTKAVVFQLASLTDAHWHMSGEVVLMTLLGGLGTIMGPVVGAVTVVTLQNTLASGPLSAYVPIVMGCIFVACVMAFRRGIVGEIKHLFQKSF